MILPTPPSPPGEPPPPPEAHLAKRVTLDTKGQWRFGLLLDTTWPRRIALASVDERIEQIYAIAQRLNVEKSARYGKVGRKTTCNVYAHDFCRLAGAYLPLVWWTRAALRQLQQGSNVVPDRTTTDQPTLKGLFRWFAEYGRAFGWRSVDRDRSLQAEANRGNVCVVIASRKHGPGGHIALVLPETRALRSRLPPKKQPKVVQTMSGPQRQPSARPRWWLNQKSYAQYAFWVHGPSELSCPTLLPEPA